MKTPLFHEDNQAMIMVINSGRNPTMRHIGRVHRVSLSWIHGRLGRHAKRDPTILFYQTSGNMSADIYTKSFKDKPGCTQASRLINAFAPAELNKTSLLAWMIEDTQDLLAEDIDQRAGWSRASKRRGSHHAAVAAVWEIVD